MKSMRAVSPLLAVAVSLVLISSMGAAKPKKVAKEAATTEAKADATVADAKPADAEADTKSDTKKTDTKKSATKKTDTKKTDTKKTDTAKSDTAKPDTAKSDTAKTEPKPKKSKSKEDKGASTITASPVKAEWWQKRMQELNARVKPGKVDLVFIGDSITQGWEKSGKDVWKKFYSERNAVNLGIGGDRTQQVLWRMENGNLDGISPKLAVVMIGTNNSHQNSPEDIAAGVKAIVAKIQEKAPKTHILLLGIFPRGADAKDKARQVNAKTNEIIATLADKKSVEYLDISSKLLGTDGTLSKEIMPDLLHLSAKGYTIWAEAIEPSVAKVLGDKSEK